LSKKLGPQEIQVLFYLLAVHNKKTNKSRDATFKKFLLTLVLACCTTVSSAQVQKLNKGLRAALADPAISARLIQLGAEPLDMFAQATREYIAKGIALWADAVKLSGATPD